MLKALSVLWNGFFAICSFQRGPQDLPNSSVLLWLALALHVVVGFFAALLEQTPLQALLHGLTETALVAVLSWSLLFSVGHPERWRQTATALGGTGVIVGLISLPVLYWLLSAYHAGAALDIPQILLICLWIWSLSILGHIFRHALSVSFWMGLLTAFAFSMLILSISYVILPFRGES